MRTGQGTTRTPSTEEETTEDTPIAASGLLRRPITLRSFLKLAAAAATAGAGQVLAGPRLG